MIQLIYLHPAQATELVSFKRGPSAPNAEGIEKLKSIKEAHLILVYLSDTLADQVYSEIENDGSSYCCRER